MKSILTDEQEPDSESKYMIESEGGKKYELKTDRARIKEFLRLLSACHDVSSAKIPDTDYYLYSGQSPDEVCLVDAAQRLGAQFVDNRSNEITLNTLTSSGNIILEKVYLLYSMPFSSLGVYQT